MKRSILLIFCFMTIASSQAAVMPIDPVAASMNADFVIVLPADQPLADVYVIDISQVGFKNEEQLQEFCQHAAENVLVVRGSFTQNKLFVSPQPSMTGANWTIADWNSYLANRAPKLKAMFQMVTAE